MNPPSEPSPNSADDPDKTIHVEGPSRSALLQENAGRILGEMLSSDIAGIEREGDSIGPYQLCELIGEGGFGNVWRAEQTLVVKREVAVKVIKLGMDTAQVLGRFNQERQALASLDHPNIATMLDAGVSPNGRPYFAMELVRGGAITSWCEQHIATLPERLRLFIQVCQAVHHAHEKGILHRDLKPTNILVTEAGGQPTPKIIDFGIAKAMQAGTLGDLSMLTQADQVIGTPIYMSPEQIKGDRELEASSDVYALGVVLYELLTGLLPFDTTTMSRAGLEAVKQMILETVPERPSTRVRRKTSTQDKRKTGFPPQLSALPADLDWITMRALEKNRERRYATAAEFAADVQRHLDCVPVLARSPSAGYKFSRWFRHHRKVIVPVCMATLIGGACAALLLNSLSPAQAGKSVPTALVAAKAGTMPPLTTADAFTNSLGMKFIPVPGGQVLYCIHETRVRDFGFYETEVYKGRAGRHQTPSGISPALLSGKAEDRPVTDVSWLEAKNFCGWLSEKEGKTYCLPTHEEWSVAAGMGTGLPAPSVADLLADGSGNYADKSLHEAAPAMEWIPTYQDGFPFMAPVMSLKPDARGLYDMGGNVREWLDEAEETLIPGPTDKLSRITRGGSWSTFRPDLALREPLTAGTRDSRTGFRLVMIPADRVRELRPLLTPLPAPDDPSPPARHIDIPANAVVNSLGMAFVSVPGTEVLFCMHETRRQDYAAYAAAVPGVSSAWKTIRFRGYQDPQFQGMPAGHKDDHPVAGVNWADSTAFCEWLSQKEGRTYRLPTSKEWNRAVGLEASRAATQFPWGVGFPPPAGSLAGNYADSAMHEKVSVREPWIEGYTDGFATTAPVMSFKPNQFNLYDLGGNVEEWVQDAVPNTPYYGVRKLTRGASFARYKSSQLLSSCEIPVVASAGYALTGFRCVLVPMTTVAKP